MLNHFLMFADEAEARSVLSAYGQQTEQGWQWDGSRVIPGQRVVIARAVWDRTDPMAPVMTTPEQTVPGYFITVTLPELNETLRDLPDAACRLIGDSATGVLLYTAEGLDPGLMANAIIEPVPAGSSYSFGGV